MIRRNRTHNDRLPPVAHHAERNPFFDIAICDFNNRVRRSPIAFLSGYVGQASRLTSNDLRPQASGLENPYGSESETHNNVAFASRFARRALLVRAGTIVLAGVAPVLTSRPLLEFLLISTVLGGTPALHSIARK
jgi:hypothetical protein